MGRLVRRAGDGAPRGESAQVAAARARRASARELRDALGAVARAALSRLGLRLGPPAARVREWHAGAARGARAARRAASAAVPARAAPGAPGGARGARAARERRPRGAERLPRVRLDGGGGLVERASVRVPARVRARVPAVARAGGARAESARLRHQVGPLQPRRHRLRALHRAGAVRRAAHQTDAREGERREARALQARRARRRR